MATLSLQSGSQGPDRRLHHRTGRSPHCLLPVLPAAGQVTRSPPGSVFSSQFMFPVIVLGRFSGKLETFSCQAWALAAGAVMGSLIGWTSVHGSQDVRLASPGWRPSVPAAHGRKLRVWEPNPLPRVTLRGVEQAFQSRTLELVLAWGRSGSRTAGGGGASAPLSLHRASAPPARAPW